MCPCCGSARRGKASRMPASARTQSHFASSQPGGNPSVTETRSKERHPLRAQDSIRSRVDWLWAMSLAAAVHAQLAAVHTITAKSNGSQTETPALLLPTPLFHEQPPREVLHRPRDPRGLREAKALLA